MINKKKLDEAIDDRRGRSSTEGNVCEVRCGYATLHAKTLMERKLYESL